MTECCLMATSSVESCMLCGVPGKASVWYSECSVGERGRREWTPIWLCVDFIGLWADLCRGEGDSVRPQGLFWVLTPSAGVRQWARTQVPPVPRLLRWRPRQSATCSRGRPRQTAGGATTQTVYGSIDTQLTWLLYSERCVSWFLNLIHDITLR